MKTTEIRYHVIAFNDLDEKMEVFSSASFPECVSVAQALYSASELEFKIFNHSQDTCLVIFNKPAPAGY